MQHNYSTYLYQNLNVPYATINFSSTRLFDPRLINHLRMSGYETCRHIRTQTHVFTAQTLKERFLNDPRTVLCMPPCIEQSCNGGDALQDPKYVSG